MAARCQVFVELRRLLQSLVGDVHVGAEGEIFVNGDRW
jgi:hypothetical protein